MAFLNSVGLIKQAPIIYPNNLETLDVQSIGREKLMNSLYFLVHIYKMVLYVYSETPIHARGKVFRYERPRYKVDLTKSIPNGLTLKWWGKRDASFLSMGR